MTTQKAFFKGYKIEFDVKTNRFNIYSENRLVDTALDLKSAMKTIDRLEKLGMKR